MRSPAEASITAFGRSSDLLDQIDYRLAQTPEEKEEIYNLRYRAYLREGAIRPSADERGIDHFDDALSPELDKGLVFIDSTRFVADPEKARSFPELPYVTVRLGSMAGVHFHADYVSAIVRPEHQAFYRRVFLQETWCEPRLYPGLVKPVGLMAAHLPTVRERVLARYPFLGSSAFARRMLFERNGQSRSSSPRCDGVPVRARLDC